MTMRLVVVVVLALAPAVAERRRIAFLIFGSSHQSHATSGHDVEKCDKGDKKVSEWMGASTLSQKVFLFEPLKKDADVDVFLAVDSCDPLYDAKFRSMYDPYVRGAVFLDASMTRKAKFNAAAGLADLKSYDSIVLSRPDLLWAAGPENVTSFFFPNTIAWPHRCEPDVWNKWQCVSDAIIVVPGQLADRFFNRCDEELYKRFLQSAHWSYNCAVAQKIIPGDALFWFGDIQIKVNSRGMRISEIPTPFYLPDYSAERQTKLDLSAANVKTHATFPHLSASSSDADKRVYEAARQLDRLRKEVADDLDDETQQQQRRPVLEDRPHPEDREDEESYGKNNNVSLVSTRDYSETLAARREATSSHGILFVRVPKAGSTSVRATVNRVCAAVGVTNAATGMLADNPMLVAGKAIEYKNHQPVDGYRCAQQHVHFGTWLYAAFPTMARSLLIAVVREPASWATSLYNNREGFCGRSTAERRRKHQDILELADGCELLRRGQFGYLGGGRRFFDSVHLKTPADVVDFYDAILVLDRLSESFVALLAARPHSSKEVLASTLPLCTFQYEHMNQNDDPDYVFFNETTTANYRTNHHLDVDLYNKANARLDHAITDIGPTSFATILHQFDLSCLGIEGDASSKKHHKKKHHNRVR